MGTPRQKVGDKTKDQREEMQTISDDRAENICEQDEKLLPDPKSDPSQRDKRNQRPKKGPYLDQPERRSLRGKKEPTWRTSETTRFINEDKQAILNALLRCDVPDIDTICQAVPTKSRDEIARYMYSREVMARRMKPIINEDLPHASKQVAARKWQELMTENSAFVTCDHSYLLGDVLALCSKLEPHFETEHTRIPQYNIIYRYFHALLRCEPLPKLKATEAAVILHVLNDFMQELKTYDSDKQLDFIINKFKQLNGNGKTNQPSTSETTNPQKRQNPETETSVESPNKKKRVVENGQEISNRSSASSTITSQQSSKQDSGESQSAMQQSSTVNRQSSNFGDSTKTSASNVPDKTRVSDTSTSASTTQSVSAGPPNTEVTACTSTSSSACIVRQSTSANSQNASLSSGTSLTTSMPQSTNVPRENENSSTSKRTASTPQSMDAQRENENSSTQRTASTPPSTNANAQRERLVVQSLNPLGIPIPLLNILKKEVELNKRMTSKKTGSVGNLTKVEKIIKSLRSLQNAKGAGDGVPNVRKRQKVVKRPEAAKTAETGQARQKESFSYNVIQMKVGNVVRDKKGPRFKPSSADANDIHSIEMLLLDHTGTVLISGLVLDISKPDGKEEILRDMREKILTLPKKQESRTMVRVRNESGQLLSLQKDLLQRIARTGKVKTCECLVVEAPFVLVDSNNKVVKKVEPKETEDFPKPFVKRVGRPFSGIHKLKSLNRPQGSQNKSATSPLKNANNQQKTSNQIRVAPNVPPNVRRKQATPTKVLSPLRQTPPLGAMFLMPYTAIRQQLTSVGNVPESLNTTEPLRTNEAARSLSPSTRKGATPREMEGLQILADAALDLSLKRITPDEEQPLSVEITQEDSEMAVVDLRTGDISWSPSVDPSVPDGPVVETGVVVQSHKNVSSHGGAHCLPVSATSSTTSEQRKSTIEVPRKANTITKSPTKSRTTIGQTKKKQVLGTSKKSTSKADVLMTVTDTTKAKTLPKAAPESSVSTKTGLSVSKKGKVPNESPEKPTAGNSQKGRKRKNSSPMKVVTVDVHTLSSPSSPNRKSPRRFSVNLP